MSRLQKAYYSGYLTVLIACFTPFKVVAYALPALFIVWMVLKVPGCVSRNRALMFLAVVLVTPAVYMLVADEFLIANYLLAVLTYSSFYPLIALDTRPLANRELLHRMLHAAIIMVTVQGVYGILQALYGVSQTGSFAGGNGDYVEGTIHPQLDAERAFGNPMFAVNMALMLLASLSLPSEMTRRRFYLVVGTVALVLASVMHVLLFMVAAVVIAVVLVRARRQSMAKTGALRSRRRLLLTIAFVSGLTYVAFPRELESVSTFAESVLDLEALELPRAIMLYRVAADLPGDAPAQPFVGLGPGQFSSRASLIASGMFLGGADAPKAIPLMTPQATRLAADYCLSLLVAFADRHDISSTQQPFFSLLSVYTELGLLGLLVIGWVVFRLVQRVQAAVRKAPRLQLQGLLVCAGILFLALLGVQENYWETPQAIFVGLLLLKIMYANVVHAEEAEAG